MVPTPIRTTPPPAPVFYVPAACRPPVDESVNSPVTQVAQGGGNTNPPPVVRKRPDRGHRKLVSVDTIYSFSTNTQFTHDFLGSYSLSIIILKKRSVRSDVVLVHARSMSSAARLVKVVLPIYKVTLSSRTPSLLLWLKA